MKFVSGDQPPEVLQPADRSLDFPATSVSPQTATVLGGRLDSVAAVRAHEFNAAPFESAAEWVAVGSQIVNEAPRQATQTTLLQQRFNQRYFVRTGAGDMDSQWQAGGITVHHDLGAFATFGLAHAIAPFFAEENVPSANVSSVLSRPSASRQRSNWDQACSQIPASVQSRSRRQQVLGDGKHWGKSFQRAPVRSIHRMPSTQSRVAAGGRPPSGDDAGAGNTLSIKSHCSSVSSDWGSILDPAGATAPLLRDRDMSDLLRHSSLRSNRLDRLAIKTGF